MIAVFSNAEIIDLAPIGWTWEFVEKNENFNQEKNSQS